jgi:lipopolysaccharide export system protein LptA
MKRSEASRYARWSAVLALVLAGITGGLYVQRKWVAHVEKKNAPPPLPIDFTRQSSSLTFTKEEGDRKIFTVQASKSTDFKGGDASLLEDVKITVFGKTGDRHDVIHTQSCKYAATDGSIQCSGEVHMDLQSAADAERAAKDGGAPANMIRVETRGVTFERNTGRAQTVEAVKFSFPNGSGEAVGAAYFSEEGVLRLVKDVKLSIGVPASKGSANKEATSERTITVLGSSLEFGKMSRTILLHGPVAAVTEAQKLTAGELTATLDQQFRAQTLIATPDASGTLPEVSAQSANEKTTLSAEKITCNLASEGWISGVQAEGSVQGKSSRGWMQARRGELEMWPRLNQAKLLTMHGDVHLHSEDAKAGTSRTLKTNALQMNFSGDKLGQASRLEHGETLERGSMEWTDSAGARSKLDADKLALDFGAASRVQQLVATGAVQTEREAKGKPTQTASAANGLIQMEPSGEWSLITLRGGVHLKEGERSGESQQAVFARVAQSAVLSGQALARDASSETRAAKITFSQASGEIEAEGNVRSTDLSAKTSSVQLSAVPANISAERMRANSKTGRALYTGHARLWQGPSVLEAESIELLRDTRELNAAGNVRGVFPQSVANQGKQGQTSLWHVTSSTLKYWDAENLAYLEKNVTVQSTDQRMRASALELFFTREAAGKQGGTASQISRAVGTGGVVVEEGDRRGTAERGEYTAADEKFVLSGGTPTLYDASEGTTTGRELTFYIADDTIIVDSGNGMRTLTKHRVQR